jgi:hypothetical protein
MKRVDWAEPYSNGGRGIEIPYMRRVMKDRVGIVGDFGVGTEKGMISTPSLGIHQDSAVFCFDKNERLQMPKGYEHYKCISWNFLIDPVSTIPVFCGLLDVAISISTIEHLGLNGYGNDIREGDDVVAILHILKLVRPSGVFYMTVPVSAVTHVLDCGWIRSYSPETLRQYGTTAGVVTEISLFRFDMAEKTWYEVEEINADVRHNGDIAAVAVVAYTKAA